MVQRATRIGMERGKGLVVVVFTSWNRFPRGIPTGCGKLFWQDRILPHDEGGSLETSRGLSDNGCFAGFGSDLSYLKAGGGVSSKNERQTFTPHTRISTRINPT